jgi:hypothetical protein
VSLAEQVARLSQEAERTYARKSQTNFTEFCNALLNAQFLAIHGRQPTLGERDEHGSWVRTPEGRRAADAVCAYVGLTRAEPKRSEPKPTTSVSGWPKYNEWKGVRF